MEHPGKYKSVQVTYVLEKGILSGPANVDINTNYDGVAFSTHIEQCAFRMITVRSDAAVYWSVLLKPLYELERLLMIFDGAFITFQDINFSEPEDETEDPAIVNNQAKAQRLSYFTTDDVSTTTDRLVDFQDVLTEDLFEKWKQLLNELDIINQMYLYSVLLIS